MTWRGRLARAWMAAVLAVGGCITKAATLAALPPVPVLPDNQQVTRSQKPDTSSRNNTALCLLNVPVEPPSEASHASPTAAIRAVVNGEPILEEEVYLAAIAQIHAARTEKERQEVFKQALTSLIERELLLQDIFAKLEKGGKMGAAFRKKITEAADKQFEDHWLKPIMKQKHLANRQELADFMRQAGVSIDMMRRMIERNYIASEYVKSRVEPLITRIGHTEITDYYNKHREEYTQPDSVEWQDIFIDASRHASRDAARQFAQSLVQRIRDGEDFAKLSAEFDNGTSGRYRKGEGEGRKRGEIRPVEAEPMLLKMHDGDLDILERARGFHVIRLVKRQYAGPIPFDAKVQKEIHDKLRMQVFLSERASIVKELKRKAVIDLSTKEE